MKRNWVDLCSPATDSYINIVQEFYANTFRVKGDTFKKFKS